MKKALILILALIGFSGPAAALVITTNVGATPETTLSNALLGASSGISIVGGSETYQGNSTFPQSGTYTGFNLAPSSGSTPTLVLPDGILLTSGHSDLPLTNTVNNFSNNIGSTTGSGSSAELSTLSASAGGSSTTNDANLIGFDFTVGAGITSVEAQFVFGTDEFPTQSVTDIFGFFVDGVNYAQFPGGELISNTPGNPTNFISNPVGGGLYDIEYNGLTQVFDVAGLLDLSLSTHTFLMGVADTSDSIWDSGVFIAGLTAGTTTGGGGICDPATDPFQCQGPPDCDPATDPLGCEPPVGVPEPSIIALFAAGLFGIGFARRRMRS